MTLLGPGAVPLKLQHLGVGVDLGWVIGAAVQAAEEARWLVFGGMPSLAVTVEAGAAIRVCLARWDHWLKNR